MPAPALANLVTAALWTAYRRTEYRIPGGVVRIGRRSAQADCILARHRCRQAVLITAWNPFSRRKPSGWNNRMQGRLKEAVRRFPVLPASGRQGRWSEDHLLVLMPPERGAVLARRFCQNAIVNLKWRQPACLNRTYRGDVPTSHNACDISGVT